MAPRDCPQATARRRVAALAAQVTAGIPGSPRSHALQKGAAVCVTGAAGYVGSWLVKMCLERGYTVRACVRNADDNTKAGFLKAMPEFGGKLTVHSADMTTAGAYDQIFEGCSIVFHPAEVFMSFGAGRDIQKAAQDFGPGRVTLSAMHKAAIATSQNIVDSINKSTTVTRLIYTASIASMMGTSNAFFHDNPAVDETRDPEGNSPESYGVTKRVTEKYFDFAAAASGGKWSVITGNPGDIIGPILSPHQGKETWQGKIADVIQGTPCPQEGGGRPWMLVDVRDVAEAEILLAESVNVPSGSRFLLSSGDKIPAEDLGVRAMLMYPEWDCATTVSPGFGAKKVTPSHPMWMRVNLRPDRVRESTGMNFRKFNDTFKATLDTLVSIGGIKPKLKSK